MISEILPSEQFAPNKEAKRYVFTPIDTQFAGFADKETKQLFFKW